MVSNLVNNPASPEKSDNDANLLERSASVVTEAFADCAGVMNKGVRIINNVPVVSLFLPPAFTAAAAGGEGLEAAARNIGTDLSKGRGINIGDAAREGTAATIESAARGFVPVVGDDVGKAVTEGTGLRDEAPETATPRAKSLGITGGMN